MKKSFLAAGLMVFTLSFLPPMAGRLLAADCRAIGHQIESETNLLKRQTLARHGVAVCPDDPVINFHHAYSLERFRDYREALKHYQQAARLDPEYAASYFGMGDMYLQLGRAEDAVKAYEFGLNLAPDARRAQRSLEQARARLEGQATERREDVASFASLLGLEPEEEAVAEPAPPVAELVQPRQAEPEVASHMLIYAAGTGGSIVGDVSQKVVAGDDGRPVVAEPEVGYQFVAWSDGRTDNHRVDSEVNGDVTVTAGFAPLVYTVSALAGSHGIIEGPTSRPVTHGQETNFVVKPDEGYMVDVEESCGGHFDGELYRTGPVTADCTVNFTFAAIPAVPDEVFDSLADGPEGEPVAPVDAAVVTTVAAPLMEPSMAVGENENMVEGERLGDTWWRVRGIDAEGVAVEPTAVEQKQKPGERLGDTWIRPSSN